MIDCISLWLSDFFQSEDDLVIYKIKQLIEQHIEKEFPDKAASLMNALMGHGKSHVLTTSLSRQSTIKSSSDRYSLLSGTSPIFKRSKKITHVMDLDASEVAKQLTLMESRLFQQIHRQELFQRNGPNDNVKAMSSMSTMVIISLTLVDSLGSHHYSQRKRSKKKITCLEIIYND